MHRKVIRTVVDNRFNNTDDKQYNLGSEYPEDSEYLQTVDGIDIDGEEDVVIIVPNKQNLNVKIIIPYRLVIMQIMFRVKEE